MEPVLITTQELAAALRIGRTQAYGLLARGELRTIRVGRGLRIPRTEVDAYVRRKLGPGGTRGRPPAGSSASRIDRAETEA
jgi:excisionase family DNA binding protein